MSFSRKLIFSILSVLLILVLLGGYYAEKTIFETATENVNQTEQFSVSYTLKEYNGFLALFLNENSEPQAIYSVCIESLPQTDINLLSQGITVSDLSSLQQLLEDYTG